MVWYVIKIIALWMLENSFNSCTPTLSHLLLPFQFSDRFHFDFLVKGYCNRKSFILLLRCIGNSWEVDCRLICHRFGGHPIGLLPCGVISYYLCYSVISIRLTYWFHVFLFLSIRLLHCLALFSYVCVSLLMTGHMHLLYNLNLPFVLRCLFLQIG